MITFNFSFKKVSLVSSKFKGKINSKENKKGNKEFSGIMFLI